VGVRDIGFGNAQEPKLQMEKMKPTLLADPDNNIHRSIPRKLTNDGITYIDNTKGGSISNRQVGMSATDMTNRLVEAGGKITPLGNNKYRIDLNNTQYTFYTRHSNKEVGVHIMYNGKPTHKYTLTGW
jgi:hypothetical protein